MKALSLSIWAFVLGSICLFSIECAHGGHIFRYESIANKSNVIMKGSSNLHDWSAEGHVINGYIEITEKRRAELLKGEMPATISATEHLKVKVAIPVRSLKSDLEGLDKEIWKDLDYKEHPNILYSFSKAGFEHGTMSSGYSFNTEGDLTVNGVTRLLNMSVTIREPDANEIVIECKTKVKMTDFKITPPSLLAGLIRAGNEVHILVHWPVARKIVKQDP